MRVGKLWFVAVALVCGMLPSAAGAQTLASRALGSLPPEVVRIEYASPARLRSLPNYAQLRQRFVGQRLLQLEQSFAQLGVREDQIDDLVLAWRVASGTIQMGGYVSGRFDPQEIERNASARGFAPVIFSGQSGYCLGASVDAACLTILDSGFGAIGDHALLEVLVAAQTGDGPRMTSDHVLQRLAQESRPSERVPIWGVAVREAIPDWFQAWLPAQENLEMDWGRAFQSVDALAYTVEASDRVRLDLKMDCRSSEAASTTRQFLEGLRLFQQLAWENTNPGKPNPFESIELTSSDRRVQMTLVTAYANLEGAAALNR
jgi:hypothetical protein